MPIDRPAECGSAARYSAPSVSTVAICAAAGIGVAAKHITNAIIAIRTDILPALPLIEQCSDASDDASIVGEVALPAPAALARHHASAMLHAMKFITRNRAAA